MATITISDARKRFGPVEVLHGVDLDIADGEFIVLVGPSGCGKSTLLRMIAGLETISAGEVKIDGRLINDLPPRERDIAMVFQSYALYPHMNVADNMGYALKLRRAGPDRIGAAIARASSILGIEALLERRPAALSGGQRQRVAMGRAIVRHPKAFLFDEPLSNLDARLREHMRAEIRTLHKRLSTTSIYVTHDQIEAMTMADRIVAMNDGVVQQVGAPLELYDRPANTFVAGFIGAPVMNFLEARATERAGEARLLDGTAIPLGGRVEPGVPLTIGVRPEDLSPAAPDVPGALAGAVSLVESTGLTTLVHVEGEAGRWAWLSVERPSVREGERLALTPRPGKLHVFDAEGRRIEPAELDG